MKFVADRFVKGSYFLHRKCVTCREWFVLAYDGERCRQCPDCRPYPDEVEELVFD